MLRRPTVWMVGLVCGLAFLMRTDVVRAAEMDMDLDGIFDSAELRLGTDPTRADTDGDGFTDLDELRSDHSPTSTAAAPAGFERSIVVSIKDQRLRQQVAGITVDTFPVSTGVKGMPTPVGTFKILGKNKRAWSRIGKLWMPWWMQFTSVHGLTVGIHELPEWPNGKKEGEDHLGKPASHGCVRLGIGAAKRIYDWAPVGTKVTVIP